MYHEETFSVNLNRVFYSVNESLKELSEIFLREGFHLYVVGGAVRDYIIGRKNGDVDLTTDALPADMKKMFKKTIDTGIKHGTVTILFKGKHYETTTFRLDGKYLDSRHPDSVSFTKDLSEDLRRRDFTINAMAAHLPSGEIIDEHGGIEDIRRRVIRAIGDAHERFEEDALRILRASRFSSKLGYDIEENTLKAMRESSQSILRVSHERIKEELFSLAGGDYPDYGIDSLYSSNALSSLFPKLSEKIDSNSLKCLKEELIRARDLKLENAAKMAVLFYRDAERVGDYLDFLKCSNYEKSLISTFVDNSDVDLRELKTKGDIRRFINRIGEERVLQFIDFIAAIRSKRDKDKEDEIREELSSGHPRKISNLAIGGNDLILLGYSGKEIGEMLSSLLDRVIEDPSLNSKERLTLLSLESKLNKR